MPDTNFKNFIDALSETLSPSVSDYLYIRTTAGNRKIRATALSTPIYNDIGTPGDIGFGVGLAETLPTGFEVLPGTLLKNNDQYGNYRFISDGSIMCYIPRFYFKITHLQVSNLTGDGSKVTVTFAATHNLYAGEWVWLEGAAGFALPKGRYLITDITNTTTIKVSSTFNTGTYTAGSCYALNSIQIKGDTTFTSEEEANAKGYALHRAFLDGGATKKGFFVDKYKWSLTNYTLGSAGIASSIAFSNPISSDNSSKRDGTNPTFAGSFSNCISNSQTPTDDYGGAWSAAKSRGNDFAVTSIFIHGALALLSLAHGQAATSTTYCAWYSATTTNFPKGNTNSGADSNDATCTFSVCDDGYWAARNEARKNGSGNSLAKTTHNGQNCGVADLSGNQWEIVSGLSAIVASKNITAISKANPGVVTVTGHGYSNDDYIQIESVVGMTEANGKIYKITVVDPDNFSIEVDTSTWTTYASGGTSKKGTFYMLNSAVALKTVTGGNSVAGTDQFADAFLTNAALNTPVVLNFAPGGVLAQRMGNSTNQVLEFSTTKTSAAYLRSCAALPGASGMSTGGTNQFGTDYFYSYLLDECCPVRSGGWSYGAYAGVWSVILSHDRSGAVRFSSARSCLYNV